MGIRRSNDPLTFADVDGIIINEVSPDSNVSGVPANIGVLVGQSQRGPAEMTDLVGITKTLETFGKDDTKGLNKVLKNKAFGRLRFIRVIASDAATATHTFTDGAGSPANIIKFDAKYKGVYGNKLKVKIEAGTVQGKKYTISDSNDNTVMSTEVYDNVRVADITSQANNPFRTSKLIVATVIATSAEPANITATALGSGSDGSVANTDYQAAIDQASVLGAGNCLFLDEYNATRNGYLKAHVASSEDKMAIVTGDLAEDDSSAAITDVANYRDTDGRLIYAFNDVITNVNDQDVTQPAAWWIASLFTQCPAYVDLAFGDNSKFLAGIKGLVNALTPAEYILLNKAGICALEYDPDIGFKVKSAVVTQILNTEKVTILRRRMTDFLQDSLGKFLKNYGNGVNSAANRKLAKAGITRFDDSLIASGVLPGDSEMTDGAKARLIDIDSQNDNDSIGQGFFKIIYKRRIFSSMRYIVLTTEIGTGVVVKEV